MSYNKLDVETFAEDVVRLDSLYIHKKCVSFFRDKIDISSTWREDDVILNLIGLARRCVLGPLGV